MLRTEGNGARSGPRALPALVRLDIKLAPCNF